MANTNQVNEPFRLVGETFGGKYRIDSLVGQGGYGVVFRATDLDLQETVAVKLLNLGDTVSEALVDRLVEGLKREGKRMRRLSRATPGIVQAHAFDAAVFNGRRSAYLVLEWLDGRTLADDLRERRERGYACRSIAEAADLLETAAQALGLAHEEGIAHCDVKPENLFLAQVGGRVMLKVLDFGIAEIVRDVVTPAPGRAVTGVGPRAFTAAYGAPEQFAPERFGKTGPWTDVHALALTVLEVVSGRPPYAGQTYEQLQAEATDEERCPSFERSGVSVPNEVAAIMRKALALDWRNRFPNAKEFWAQLRQAIRLEPERAAAPPSIVTEPSSTPEPRPIPPVRPEAAQTTATPVTSHPRVLPEKLASGDPAAIKTRARSRRSTFVVALAAGALLAGAGLLTRLSGSHATRVPEDQVLIPEGRYVIGSPAGDVRKCEGPQRSVYVLAFLMDRTEVTLSDYLRCEKAGKCSSTKPHWIEQKQFKGLELCNELRSERGEHLDDNPINCVDRSQAAAYCAFVGKRLATDEEWEAAARGAGGQEYPWGNTAPTCEKAVYGRPPNNVCPGFGTARIATTPASTSGVFDLAGNVWEWTSTTCAGATPLGAPPSPPDAIPMPSRTPVESHDFDREQAELARLLRQAKEPDVQFDPGPGSLRGGGFEWSVDNLRSWKHLAFPPDQGGVSTGFRCAKDAL